MYEERQMLREKITTLDGGLMEAQRLKEEDMAVAKEERIELLRRQSMRRMLNAGLANAWSAWFELWEAKTYSINRLRQCANKLKSPALSDAFVFWAALASDVKAEAEYMALAQRAAGLDDEKESMATELERLRQESERALEAAAEDKRIALERQLIALTGTAEEQAAMLAEEAKMQRVELLRRQVMRRILNQNIVRGWTAWLELWQVQTRRTCTPYPTCPHVLHCHCTAIALPLHPL